jgi:hypothetical protein
VKREVRRPCLGVSRRPSLVRTLAGGQSLAAQEPHRIANRNACSYKDAGFTSDIDVVDDSVQKLEQEERAISRRRRNLQDRMDFVRNLGGHDQSSRDRLARLEAEEKDISEQRRQIQKRLDDMLAKTKRNGDR